MPHELCVSVALSEFKRRCSVKGDLPAVIKNSYVYFGGLQKALDLLLSESIKIYYIFLNV